MEGLAFSDNGERIGLPVCIVGKCSYIADTVAYGEIHIFRAVM